ncbi:MAG: phosphate signaling complex protein PhoU [Phycisphaerae bacterium]
MTAQFVRLLDELQRRSLRMASLVEDILQEACEAAFDADERLASRAIQRDRDVDYEEVEIEAETVRLMALYQPVGCDIRFLCTVLKVNNDLERIADCAVNIAERAQHLDHEGLDKQEEAIHQMAVIVRRMLRSAIQAYGVRDAVNGKKVFPEDDAVDALYGQIIRSIVADAAGQPDRMAAFLDILSIAKNLERIADHATNIVEDVVFLTTGDIVRHQDH